MLSLNIRDATKQKKENHAVNGSSDQLINSLLHVPIHAIKTYKRPAGNKHSLATTPQSHLRPLDRPSIGPTPENELGD